MFFVVRVSRPTHCFTSLMTRATSPIRWIVRFDREPVNGRAPRIETFLADAPKLAQDGLLAELLAMEFE